jgi:hypothetical protein
MADLFVAISPSRQEGCPMPGATPRLPELYQPPRSAADDDFHVSELATDHAGAQSPFGADVELPLPYDRLSYRHPTISERPHLAGD